MDKKKADIILVFALIILGAGGLLIFRYMSDNGSDDAAAMRLEITMDGESLYSERVDKMDLPFTFETETKNGGKNIFTVDMDENGKIGASCIYADCPDKICMDTGRITLRGETIVCLPHRVTAGLY